MCFLDKLRRRDMSILFKYGVNIKEEKLKDVSRLSLRTVGAGRFFVF